MSSSTRKVPANVQQQIDQICSEFESAWQEGQTPPLSQFLYQIDEAWQVDAFRRLLDVERNYRRDENGQSIADDALFAIHRDSLLKFAQQLAAPPADGLQQTVDLPASKDRQTWLLGDSPAPEPDATADHVRSHSRSRSRSRGLQIRCPHCSNAVEVLTDTAYESVSCQSCGSAFNLVDRQEESRQASTLTKIGRFELISRVGLGGFGTVWKARDTELDRIVAVKIPRKGQLDDAEIDQFFREARSAAQLRHPNIVAVHEVGREDDTIFIVSDLIRGVTLSDWISDVEIDLKKTAQIMATIAAALHHAHEKGVIHRDLKPANILVDTAGDVHIMDFGLAKREVGEITMTMEGHILGTPAYMSPEQAGGKGHASDRRSDIYSLGVILFRMITGEMPFRGNAQMQIHRRLSEDAPDPRKLNRHIPKDLSTICLKCLERDPNGRYPTSGQLADELLRFTKNEPIRARPISRFERVVRWARRKPALASAAALTAILAVGGPLVAIVIEGQRQRLADLVAEKDNLIGQYAGEKQQDANRLQKLSQQLDLWEGRANPWDFWPPRAERGPRQTLLEKIFERKSASVLKQLKSGQLDRDEQIFSHLGLAIMSDQLGKSQAAREQYQAAQEILTQLVSQPVDTRRYQVTLADCLLQMARLDVEVRNSEGQPVETRQLLVRSAEVLEEVNRAESTTQGKIRQFETQLKVAAASGFESGTEHLLKAKQIEEEITANLPSDPAEFYQLVCGLANREDVLKVGRIVVAE